MQQLHLTRLTLDKHRMQARRSAVEDLPQLGTYWRATTVAAKMKVTGLPANEDGIFENLMDNDGFF